MVTASDSAAQEGASVVNSRRFYGRLAWGALLMVGMAYGWFAMQQQKAAVQHRAAEQIVQLGGNVFLDYQWKGRSPLPDPVPAQPRWLRQCLGTEVFDRVVAVELHQVQKLAKAMQYLKQLPYLQYVDASQVPLTDEHSQVFSGMGQLTFLDLSGTNVSDRGLSALTGLVHLEFLSLAHTRVSRQGIRYLERLRRLQTLDLRETQVDQEAAERLAGILPRCRVRYGSNSVPVEIH